VKEMAARRETYAPAVAAAAAARPPP